MIWFDTYGSVKGIEFENWVIVFIFNNFKLKIM
jgi:hypothetical protein